MKQYLLRISTWLVLAMAAIVTSPTVLAQEDSTTSGDDGPGFHRGKLDFLTPAERQELFTARKAVMTANPNLKQQGETLREQGKSLRSDSNATPEEKKSFFEQWQSYNKTVRSDMLQQDPNLQPIFDKIAQHFKGQGDNNGDSQNDSSTNAAPPTS